MRTQPAAPSCFVPSPLAVPRDFPSVRFELAIGWREDDGVDEPSQRLSGFRAGLLTFQGVTGTGNQSSELTRSRRRALVGGCSSLYNAAT
jgi:hypothetical protein